MEVEKVKRYLESSATIDGDKLPLRFFERLIMHGLRVELIETNRVVFSFKNEGNYLHSGAVATFVDLVSSAAIYTAGGTFVGTSVEINISFMDAAHADEDIEIEAKALHVGKAVAVLSAEFRKKSNGKIIAQGRHTMYLPLPSKM
ncbi:acyl-coenzyme A thioesterase 13 isoform X2 [Gossypium hirsutum]|uniref:Acyl-coenzyme A thioesterase 13 n=1 Tax=Gossypium hirsutum TaxID=3635 RepID=A0A1U8LVR5_GOSHI|nr:acyl-coenzyme A thioesterase 13-like isoform X2 [Gossypium hirsutum]